MVTQFSNPPTLALLQHSVVKEPGQHTSDATLVRKDGAAAIRPTWPFSTPKTKSSKPLHSGVLLKVKFEFVLMAIATAVCKRHRAV
jgi:hypothetical protein